MRFYVNQPIGTVPRARQLRREAPEPERRLLRALREASPHRKWRHQLPVGPFHVDIACIAERLGIEVDGDTHALTVEEDRRRTRVIEAAGLHMIRVSNADVMTNLDGVLAHIAAALGREKGSAA